MSVISITIRDSTLREGIELPGVNLSLDDKIQIAKFLESMHVPEIEIGMPYGLKDCLPLAEVVKSKGLNLKTSALVLSYSSTWKDEIRMAADSSLDRIEVLFPASDNLLSLKNYYNIQKEKLPQFVNDTVRYAKQHLKAVGVGFVDATQTDINFLCCLTQAAQKASADRVIIYDTAGVTTPENIKKIISTIKKESSLSMIVHCHNDFGLATANTIAGIQAGAQGADVVMNGLGDRGGNAPFEEVVLALEKLYKISTGVKLEKILELSKLVEEKTGIQKCLVKPIVGDFMFLHSPVQHIRNVAEGNYRGFEPFTPELIGAQRKYAFTLPVDYSPALEPFFEKLGVNPDGKTVLTINDELRVKSQNGGLSGQQVFAIIEKVIKEK